MTTSKRAATVAALLAVAVLAWWMLRGNLSFSTGVPSEPPSAVREGNPPPRPEAPQPPPPGVLVSPEPPPAGPRVEFPEGPASAGEVVGVVLMLPGRTPVEGALIRLLGGGSGREAAPFPRPSVAGTGANGIFRIAGFAPGTYTFNAEFEGHPPRMFRATISEGAGADGIEVLLGGGGAVEGRVDGASGRVAGVRVRINRSGVGSTKGLLSCTTDAGGMYRFEDLPSVDYFVEVVVSGSSSRGKFVTVAAGETARLDFPAGASLAGVLLDEDGAPLPEAYVRVIRIGEVYSSTQTRTGKDGGYRIEVLEPGAVRIGFQVTGEGGFSVNVLDATLAAGENHVDLRLGHGNGSGVIAGRVVARATGVPAGGNPGAITLYAGEDKDGEAGPPSQMWGLAFPDAQGRFRFPGLRAGRYLLLLQSFRELVGTEVEVVLAAGERRTGLEIGLEPAAPWERPVSAASLSGTVTDAEGRPLARATIRVNSAAKEDVHRQGNIDEIGRYRVERLDPGKWTVEVQGAGKDPFAANVADVAIRAGENTLDVRLGRGDLEGEIRGRVFERTSRRPLTSKEVQLALSTIQPDGSPRYAAAAFADGEGAFRFPFLRGGRYRLTAAPLVGGLALREFDPACAPGEKVAGVEVALVELRTGTVRFTVRNPGGRPVREVSIESRKDGKREQGSLSANAVDGVYETHFAAGTHTVTIRDAAGKLSAERAVEVKEDESTSVEIVLKPREEER